MTTLTMKIKKAVSTEKQSDFIYLSMTELNTLVNMRRVKVIRVSTEYNPTSDIESDIESVKGKPKAKCVGKRKAVASSTSSSTSSFTSDGMSENP